MNNKLRKQILKELNSLLNEQEVDYSGAKAGGSFGSGPLGRGIATTATGLGAAGVAGAGAIGAGVGSAMGGTALGGAAAGIAGGVVFAPVAIGALALGAAFLAFRTAGWKEVSEDISDADFISDDEVAAKLTTKKYLDLTAMQDATDESDMKSFMAAMKGFIDAYKDTKNLEEYQTVIQQLQTNKGILDKVCDNFVLLNEFGLDDKMYYVKCAKVRAFSIPPGLQVPAVSAPTAATPAVQQESKRRRLSEVAEAAPAETTPAPVGAVKCNEIPGIKIPVSLFAVALESEIENSPRVRPPEGELPLIVCPYLEQICTGIVPEPGPSPTPGPVPAGACKRCVSIQEGCKGTNVKEVQDKLVALKFMVANDTEIVSQTFGPNTKAAVQKFQTSKKLKSDGVVGPKTCRGLGISGGGKGTGGGGTGGGGTGGGGDCSTVQSGQKLYDCIKQKIIQQNPAVKDKLSPKNIERFYKTAPDRWDAEFKVDNTTYKLPVSGEFVDRLNAISGGKNAIEAIPGKSEDLMESKNYYDNKKINEAKQLFNKLLKNL